jgi:hypothetical protein
VRCVYANLVPSDLLALFTVAYSWASIAKTWPDQIPNFGFLVKLDEGLLLACRMISAIVEIG